MTRTESPVNQIERYIMGLKTYQKMKEEEMLEMAFEEATAMIKLNTERTRKKYGSRIGIKQG